VKHPVRIFDFVCYAQAFVKNGTNVEKKFELTVIMNDHAGRKSACGRDEMGNNEFSWNGT